MGCRRAPEPAFQRIAIPPFENLTGDPQQEWLGSGLAELLAAAISGGARVQPVFVGSMAAAYNFRATHVLHGYFSVQHGKWKVAATLEDLRSLKMVRAASAETSVGGNPGALAERLAGALGLGARSVRLRNEAALRAYIEARQAGDPGPKLEQALVADPDFAPAYDALARYRLARGDVEGGRAVINRALERPGLDRVDRARLNWLASSLIPDPATQLRALEELASATPADSEVWQLLASRRLSRRDYSGAVQAFQEAVARDPDNGYLLNEAGYACAYAGDIRGALELLERYRKLQPAEPNPEDSLGDVYFQFGRFAEAAAHYVESAKKSPVFAGSISLLKAAYAHRLAGERQAAEAWFAKYVEERRRAGDPWSELRRAEWEYLTGRARQATARLAAWIADAQRQPEQRAMGWCFLAAWSLEAGDLEMARRYARQAANIASSRQAQVLARLCLMLGQPPASVQEWELRAQRAFAGPGEQLVRETALAYALLLGGHHNAAVGILRDLLARTSPEPSEALPVMLAWALLESGQQADQWLARWPVPPSGLEPFACLVFPRVVYLHARALENQGRRQEARDLYRLFLDLAGERKLAPSERQRAESAARP